MYNTIKKLMVSVLAISGIISSITVSAADFAFTNPLKVVSQDASSVTISWDELPGANGYIVMYGPASSDNGLYDNELPDLVEGKTTATIPGLTAGQKIYIAVSAIDSNFEEGAISDELEFTLSGEATPATTSSTPTTSGAFSIVKAEVLSELEVRVTFSADVEDYETSLREFMVTEKADKSVELFVANSRVENKNTVVIELGSQLEANKEYELVAISISDVNGNTIQSGADGVVTFVLPEVQNASTEVLNAANDEPVVETPAAETPVVETPVVETTAEPQVDAAVAAAEAEVLPQTGPKEVMMVILALMLGLIVAIMRRRA